MGAKRWTAIGLGIALAAILGFFLIAGLKHVSEGTEALRVADSGEIDAYSPGWHYVRPFSGKFLVYPTGRQRFRYPEEGSTRVLTKDGQEVTLAFSFQIRIPSGSAMRLYENFGQELSSGLAQVFRDAVEIQAAEYSSRLAGGTSEAYADAVAEDIRKALSETSLSLLSADVDVWRPAGVGEGTYEANVLPEPPRKVVFIGVDGADWQIIDPLIEKGRLPNFKKIVEGGATGPLRSIEPLLSPLIWTTMATGKLPEEHGILNFTVEDPETGKRVPITRMYRRVDAFWNMMTDAGRTVDVIGWLASFPAERINGVMVTDKVGYLAFASPEETHPSGSVSPQERYDEIARLIVKSEDVPFEEIKHIIHVDEQTFSDNRGGAFDPKNVINNMILIYASTMSYQNIARHLLENDHPDFLGVYLEFLDAMCHLFMPYAPPRQREIGEEEYRKYKDAVDEFYVLQDRMIGEFIDLCDENTVVMIASDHGFKSGTARLKSSAEIGGGHAAQWHRLYGIICLYGNGIRPGYRIEGASVIDIAPTILALQGFPRAQDMPGKSLVDAFEQPLREALNPATVATLQRARAVEAPEGTSTAAADEATMKKLEALGYLTPENPDGLNNLGQRYQERGEYEKAIEAYRKALDQRPNFPSALNNLGICYGSLKRYPEAEESFRKALAIDPKDIFAMNNLAVMYMHMGRPERGQEHAEKAVEIEPSYINGHITLGSIYALLRKFDLAETEFQKALELDPANPSAKKNLDRVRTEKKKHG